MGTSEERPLAVAFGGHSSANRIWQLRQSRKRRIPTPPNYTMIWRIQHVSDYTMIWRKNLNDDLAYRS
jgi:hypothetical protein